METKKWYQSKTIWGIIISAAGFIAAHVLEAPVEISENADFEQLKAHVEAVKAAKSNVTVIISEVVAAVGSVLAIIGRVKSEGKIA
jgi:hypothetical protein